MLNLFRTRIVTTHIKVNAKMKIVNAYRHINKTSSFDFLKILARLMYQQS